ncbi:MAG: Tat pathway signal protein, partial [Atopobium sp.]|nr:Tat pathway signal protein [Atopobium sp.]
KGSLYIVKSRASYVLVDPQNQTANWLYSMDRSVDYGEFPAREGNCDSFVTYSTVKDPTSGYPASVTVRVFSL